MQYKLNFYFVIEAYPRSACQSRRQLPLEGRWWSQVEMRLRRRLHLSVRSARMNRGRRHLEALKYWTIQFNFIDYKYLLWTTEKMYVNRYFVFPLNKFSTNKHLQGGTHTHTQKHIHTHTDIQWDTDIHAEKYVCKYTRVQ